jgi:cation transport regulator
MSNSVENQQEKVGERGGSNPQIDASDKQLELVNQQSEGVDQADLAKSQTSADAIAAQRDDVDETGADKLPAEVTEQLLDGADQVFMAAFKNVQQDGLTREAALQVAWNSVKQGFVRGEDGAWHRKASPDDNVLSSGVGGSAS